MSEKRWTDMSLAELDAFMHAHPTFCMTPKQASDWWAGVETLIRRDLRKYDDPAQWPSDWSRTGGTTYFQGVPEANPDRSGLPQFAGRRK